GQPPVHLRQAGPQRVQLAPQVGPGLAFGGVRPELAGYVLPALRRAPVHQQEPEQGHGTRRSQREHDGVVRRDPRLAEQRNVEHDPDPPRRPPPAVTVSEAGTLLFCNHGRGRTRGGLGPWGPGGRSTRAGSTAGPPTARPPPTPRAGGDPAFSG